MAEDESSGSLGNSRRATNLASVALFVVFMVSLAVEPVEITLNVIAFIGLGVMVTYGLSLVVHHFWLNFQIDREIHAANQQNGGEAFRLRRAALAKEQADRLAREAADPPTDPALEPVRKETT